MYHGKFLKPPSSVCTIPWWRWSTSHASSTITPVWTVRAVSRRSRVTTSIVAVTIVAVSVTTLWSAVTVWTTITVHASIWFSIAASWRGRASVVFARKIEIWRKLHLKKCKHVHGHVTDGNFCSNLQRNSNIGGDWAMLSNMQLLHSLTVCYVKK